MQPVEYLRALQRRFPIVVTAPALAVLAALLTSIASPAAPSEGEQIEAYRATHTFFRDLLDQDEKGSVPSLQTIALFATTGAIPERVAVRLGRPPEDGPSVAEQIEVEADQNLGTLRVVAQEETPEAAEELAAVYAEEITSYLTEQQAAGRQETIDRAAAQLVGLEQRIRELDGQLVGLDPAGTDALLLTAQRDAALERYTAVTDSLRGLEAELLDPIGLVTLERSPAAPLDDEGGLTGTQISLAGRLLIAAALGLVLGVVLALVLDRVDTRMRTGRDAEQAFGLPVLAEVPRFGRFMRSPGFLVAVTRPASPAAEAYRKLRVALQLMPRWLEAPAALDTDARAAAAHSRNGSRARVVLVTSPGGDEGKSITAANLAATFAEIGKRVLLLDCDFRRAVQHDMFDVERAPGMSDFLGLSDPRPDMKDLAQATRVPGLQTVPAGSVMPNPGRLLGGDVSLLNAAQDIADVVLIDCGPVLSVNDAVALVPQVDAVVLIARSGRTTVEAAEQTAEQLARVKAPVLGVVLTSVPTKLLERSPFGRTADTATSTSAPDETRTPAPTDAPAATARQGGDEHALAEPRGLPGASPRREAPPANAEGE